MKCHFIKVIPASHICKVNSESFLSHLCWRETILPGIRKVHEWLHCQVKITPTIGRNHCGFMIATLQPNQTEIREESAETGLFSCWLTQHQPMSSRGAICRMNMLLSASSSLVIFMFFASQRILEMNDYPENINKTQATKISQNDDHSIRRIAAIIHATFIDIDTRQWWIKPKAQQPMLNTARKIITLITG